jgi:hypothetical protein
MTNPQDIKDLKRYREIVKTSTVEIDKKFFSSAIRHLEQKIENDRRGR